MNFTCTECNDTGSRDKSGDYLDCGHCDAAMQRKALNDWLASQYHQGAIAKVDSMDAWRIHQRALAMAPKQEAPRQWVAIKDSEWVNIVNHDHAYEGWDKDYIINHVFKLTEAKCKELNGPGAAAAFANGALTDERAAFESDTLDLYPSAKFNRFPSGTYTDSSIETQWGAWQRRSKFAAAGPDAALVKALEKAEKKFLELEHMLGGGDDEVSVEVEILTIRAALSGAKGN